MTKELDFEEIRADFLRLYMQSSDANQDMMDIIRKTPEVSNRDAEKIVMFRAAWEFEALWKELIEGKILGLHMEWKH